MSLRKYYITDDLAFRLWRRAREARKEFAVPTRAAFAPSFPVADDWIALASYLDSWGVGRPYSFLVSDSSQRRVSQNGFSSVLCQNVPEHHSFMRIVDPALEAFGFALYIASPELNFVQMASRFTLVQAIGYGFELCGWYTPDECARLSPNRLPAVANAQKLIAFAEDARSVDGVVKARRAARHVLDNAASVKETEVAMMFTLPRRLRGFAVVRPELNYSIDPESRDRPFVSQDSYEVDLYWPDARVGVEVQTNKHHGNGAGLGDKWIRDARRRNTLQYFGNTIIEATPGDFSSALGLAGLAEQVCKLAGFRIRPGQFDVDLPQLALYREVFDLSNRP